MDVGVVRGPPSSTRPGSGFLSRGAGRCPVGNRDPVSCSRGCWLPTGPGCCSVGLPCCCHPGLESVGLSRDEGDLEVIRSPTYRWAHGAQRVSDFLRGQRRWLSPGLLGPVHSLVHSFINSGSRATMLSTRKHCPGLGQRGSPGRGQEVQSPCEQPGSKAPPGSTNSPFLSQCRGLCSARGGSLGLGEPGHLRPSLELGP